MTRLPRDLGFFGLVTAPSLGLSFHLHDSLKHSCARKQEKGEQRSMSLLHSKEVAQVHGPELSTWTHQASCKGHSAMLSLFYIKDQQTFFCKRPGSKYFNLITPPWYFLPLPTFPLHLLLLLPLLPLPFPPLPLLNNSFVMVNFTCQLD